MKYYIYVPTTHKLVLVYHSTYQLCDQDDACLSLLKDWETDFICQRRMCLKFLKKGGIEGSVVRKLKFIIKI